MHESEHITADTPLDERETRELISRLSGPNSGSKDNRATVQDLAEAMDLDVNVVASRLAQIREENQPKPVAKEAQKLAAILEVMKTPSTKEITAKRTWRIALVSFAFVMIVLGGFVYIGFKLSSEPHGPPPVRTDLPDSLPDSDGITKKAGPQH